jgi:hypothetical protein
MKKTNFNSQIHLVQLNKGTIPLLKNIMTTLKIKVVVWNAAVLLLPFPPKRACYFKHLKTL